MNWIRVALCKDKDTVTRGRIARVFIVAGLLTHSPHFHTPGYYVTLSTPFYLSAPGVAQGFREAAAELRAKLAVPDAEKGNIATVTS